MTKQVRSTLPLAACVCALWAAQPVTAQTGDEIPTIEVPVEDLNLAQPAGVETLYRRVRSAVGRVCRRSVGRNRNHAAAYAACRHNAFAGAEQQIEVAIARTQTQLASRGVSSAQE